VLTVNAAAYYYSYTNLQIPIAIAQTAGGLTQSETSFYNVPKSITEGIEFEINWTPIDNLNLYASYSYDNAYITQGSAADGADPNAIGPNARPLFNAAQCAAQLAGNGGNPIPGGCTGDIYTGLPSQLFAGVPGNSPVIPGDPNQGWNIPQSLKGNRLPNAPRNKIAINATYNWDMGNAGTVIPSVTYIWRDVQYGALFSEPWYAAPAWDEWDARITWKSKDDRVEFILFGKNIGNKIGYDQGAIAERLSSVTNVIGPTGTITTFNYVQGVNGPAGFNAHVPGTNGLGIGKIYYPTPPFTVGLEFHYKFF
jgi:iron complex outermembrane receptor protein